MTSTYYTGEERSKRIFAIVGASSGNLVEWFDFYVYAFCAIYFAPAFFPSDDPTVQLLNTLVCSPQVFDAPHRWLDLRPPRRPPWSQEFPDDLGADDVLRLLMIACLPTYGSIGTWPRHCCCCPA